MCLFYSNTFHTQQVTILEILVLRAFREHSNQTLHSKHLVFQVCCFYSNTFHTQQITTLEILVLRAFREHSNQTLHSHLLIFHVCYFYSNTFHTPDNLIGDSGAESISRALQSNTSLKTLNISGVLFLFNHLSHPTDNNFLDCEYHTEKSSTSITQVREDNPAKRENLDIAVRSFLFQLNIYFSSSSQKLLHVTLPRQ